MTEWEEGKGWWGSYRRRENSEHDFTAKLWTVELKFSCFRADLPATSVAFSQSFEISSAS